MTGFASELQELLRKHRGIDIGFNASKESDNPLTFLRSLAEILRAGHHDREADALSDVYQHCLTQPDFGGLGYTPEQELDESRRSEVLFLVSSYLEALNSQDRYSSPLIPLDSRPEGRRGMTLAEKIFAAHDVERKGEVKPGDVIRVDVDWVMVSPGSTHLRFHSHRLVTGIRAVLGSHGEDLRGARQAWHLPQ